MDWKVFFEKILVEYKKSPVFNIYLAPEHTAATQELTKQKIVEIQREGDYHPFKILAQIKELLELPPKLHDLTKTTNHPNKRYKAKNRKTALNPTLDIM